MELDTPSKDDASQLAIKIANPYWGPFGKPTIKGLLSCDLNAKGQLSDSLRQDEIVDVHVQPAMSEETEEFQSAGVVGLAPLTEKSTETTDAITKSQSLIHELETLLKEYAGVGEEASQAVEEDCPSCIGDKLQASNMDEKDENHVAIQSMSSNFLNS